SGINVIVEGFTPGITEIIAQYHAQGARFVILATEEPTERGFNHGLDQEMVLRQREFPNAAKYAEAIFHLVPGDRITSWYSQFAPAAPVELGYARSLIRSTANDVTPTFDFGFYGSLSQRRIKILKKLARRTQSERAIKIVGDFLPQAERDQAMR